MEIMTVVMFLIASIVYAIWFWLPKRLRDKKQVDDEEAEKYGFEVVLNRPDTFDPKKFIKTLLVGLTVGIFMMYYGIEMTPENWRMALAMVFSDGFIVVFIDRGTVLVWRLALRIKKRYL